MNYYEAHLSEAAEAGTQVLTLPLDALAIEGPVALVKIDAEGHEATVLAGMQGLLRRAMPVLIVETWADAAINGIRELGYGVERLPGSSNIICRPTFEA